MASRAALGVSVGCLLMLFLRGDLGQCAVPRSAFRLCATGGFALAPLSASAAQLQALLQKRSGKDLTSPIFNIPPKQQVYPSWLEGHWSVLSRFVGFEFPTLPRQQVMRQEDVPGFKTCSIIDFADVGKSPLEYNLTYVRDDNVGGVVEDWPQNLRSTVAAHLSPGKGRVTSVDYTPSQDPNRLTMRLGCGLSYRKIAEDFLKLKRDVKKAATNGKRAVSLFQEIQDPQEEANGWHMLAEIYAAEGDLAEASQCVSNARTLCRSLKDHLAETKAMECLVTALLEHDQFQEGIKVAKEIVSVHHDAGDREREGFALISLAQHLLRFYDFANAEKVASAADFIFKSIHDKEGVRVSQQLKDAAEHGIKAEHVQQAVAQRQEFLNLPQPLIIDPGRNTRMQEAFTAFAKAA